MISADTGTVHLAASVGVTTIVLFGPGDPKIWAPPGDNHQILQNKIKCYGCKQPHCYQKNYFCMEKIEVEDVIEAIRKAGVN